ncbi:hypothetical protein E4T50_13309 [Aureobasidium sp. EXF-12298]|nr:hypothetical protein E4T50_13309 [Aureobasidium sp. EXF-12298]
MTAVPTTGSYPRDRVPTITISAFRFTECLTAAHNLLDAFLSLDISLIRALPTSYFVQITHTAIVLVKLHFAAEGLPNHENLDLKADHYFERLVKKVSGWGVLWSAQKLAHTFGRLRKMLQRCGNRNFASDLAWLGVWTLLEAPSVELVGQINTITDHSGSGEGISIAQGIESAGRATLLRIEEDVLAWSRIRCHPPAWTPLSCLIDRKWTRSSTAAASTSTVAAQPTSATSVAPSSTSTSSSTSSTIAVAPTSAVVVTSSAKASSTTSSAAPTSSSTGTGKRGLAYNTASLMTCFEDSSHVSWGYNWDSDSAGLSSSFNYVPLLWGLSHTDVWNTRATSAIANGATHLMSFNEPDMTSQANMSPQDAASAYKTWMMPFAGKAKLGAPAVTNGQGSMGLNWLAAFLEACDGCQVDFVTIHWYDAASNTAYFKEHVQNATDVAGGKPVWVTEFAPTGSPSNADISTFLEDVMPWMDSQSFVERYSYFMASDGALISGTEPSTFGQTYATYSS